MKAVVYDKTNSPAALVLREVEKPVPQDNEVLVAIRATGVNAADYRSMQLGIIPPRKIFGADIAGRVEAAGKAVTQFLPGDDVVGDISGCGFGGFAEYVAVPANVLARKPANVTYPQAAAVPMAAVTALQGLRDRGNLQPGQRVLIYGAGGGVGNFAVQLAGYLGGRVTAVCSASNGVLVRSLGAERVVDYAQEDILRGGEQFDLILGVNGSHPLTQYRRALTPKGIYVMVGGGLSQVIKTILFGPLLSIGSRKVRALAAKPSVSDLAWVLERVAEGAIRPIIDRTYPLNETAEAVEYIRQGHARGKVIITQEPV